jgi:hypothetical protein
VEAATSHFLDLPFLPFFLLFLRPPGMTGLIAGFFVGDAPWGLHRGRWDLLPLWKGKQERKLN